MRSRRLTIGFLTDSVALGGMERHTISLVRELMFRGHRVVLLELGHEVYSARTQVLGDVAQTFTGVALPDGEMSRVPTSFWLRLLRHHELDMVVLAKGTFDQIWPRLDLAIWLSGLPSVCIEHGYPPPNRLLNPGCGWVRRLAWLGLRRLRYAAKVGLHRRVFTLIVAVSNRSRRRLVDDYGYRQERVVAVHNGVDTAIFHYSPEARKSARVRWAVPDSAFVFGTLGRFSPEKRLDRALHAFSALVTAHPERLLFLVLTGFGPEEASLRRLASDLDLADRCIWPGESIAPWADLPGLDCYLLTSDTEGLPYSLIEAMACERVAVAVEVGGVGEVLLDYGVLVGNAVPDVTSAMTAVLSWSAEKRAALGRRARLHVIQRHDYVRQVGAVVSLIEASPGRGGVAGMGR